MKIERLSPSSYNTWDNCQQKFFLENNMGYRYPAGKAADKGTVAHRVLELLALIKQREQDIEEKKKIKGDPNIISLTGGKYKIDINNYTIPYLLNEVALKSFRENYFTKAELREINECIRTALDFNDGEYDPRSRTIVMPEKRVKIELPEEWARRPDGSVYYLSGIIDLVCRLDDNTYEIQDYKCGQLKDWNTGKKKVYSDFWEDPQLRMYHWALCKLYGFDKNYVVSILYLKAKQFFTFGFSPEDAKGTESLLRDRFWEIEACQVPALNRTWSCNRFCPFGTKTTQGTNFPQQLNETYGAIAKIGEPETICDCAHRLIQIEGIDAVQEKYKKNK